jgi:hypothetical protein
MSAYRCHTVLATVVTNRQQELHAQASHWRQAKLAEARATSGIGDSGWHWAELKGAALAIPRRFRPGRRAGFARSGASAPPGQA